MTEVRRDRAGAAVAAPASSPGPPPQTAPQTPPTAVPPQTPPTVVPPQTPPTAVPPPPTAATAASSTATGTGHALKRRVPVLVAWLVRVTAVIAILDVVRPRVRTAQHVRYDEVSSVVAITAAVLSMVAALLLAGAIARRRRRAWRVMTVVASIGVLVHLHDGAEPGEGWRLRVGNGPGLVVNAILLILLVVFQAQFRARSLRSSRWLALRVFLTTALVSIVVGLLVVHHLAPRAGMWALLVQTVTGLLGSTPDLPFAHRRGMGFSGDLLATLGLSTLLLSLAAFLAPASGPAVMPAIDEARLRELLANNGSEDSLGYFGLRRDKTAVFSASGKAAVVYRVVGGCSLAAGDPLGDPEAWPGAITAWLAEAESFAWTPGVLGASETGAAAYARAGLDALELGDEAVLDLSTWRLDGRQMRGVRQAVNRARRTGHTVEIDRQRDLAPPMLAEILAAAERYRDGEVERGFSMALGRVGAACDPDMMLVRVRDAAGSLVAVLAFAPWGRDGISLDLMRRAPDAENGVVELAVATLAGRADELGLRRVSLNFAVFRSALERGAKIGAGPVSRAWRSCLLLGSRWWQIDSLYRANAKYQPIWVPRFLCFRASSELAQVCLAALEAEAFVQRPRLLRLLGR